MPVKATRTLRDSLRLAAALVLVGLIVIFTLQNTDKLKVQLLFWSLEASGAIFVFVLFAAGVAVGWVWRSLRSPYGFRLFGQDRAAPPPPRD